MSESLPNQEMDHERAEVGRVEAAFSCYLRSDRKMEKGDRMEMAPYSKVRSNMIHPTEVHMHHLVSAGVMHVSGGDA